jgi:hypothetical protein
LSRDIQKPKDASAAPDTHIEQAQALSNYANGLANHGDSSAVTTTSSLPSLQIFDASSHKQSTEKPGFLSRLALGASGTVEAVATGAC